MPQSLSDEEINNRFGFHKATIEGPNAKEQKHADLRHAFMKFATELDEACPSGRYKSLMLTALEESSMWAHKALANE